SATTGTHEDEATAQLLAVEVGVQLALPQALNRILTLLGRPRAGIPHDDVATAVLPRRDDTLEVDVLHRMVLDLEGRPSCLGIQGGPFGYPPADHPSVDLEPEVVMQPPRAVQLHHDPPRAAVRALGGRTRRFRRPVEVALLPVRSERVLC